MRKIIIFIGILSLFGCETKNNLSPTENELVNKVGFDIELMSDIKDATKSKLEQLPMIDNETGEVLDEFYKGIHSTVSENKANSIVKKLKDKFKSKGYLIFVFEGENFDEKSIAVFKGKEELEILKYRRTDGINHGHENKDIIAKMTEWRNKYGLIVIGCGRDWLEVEFTKKPSDIDEFANEVYEFCPDIVDQGVGSVDALKEAIQQMNGIWLWWD